MQLTCFSINASVRQKVHPYQRSFWKKDTLSHKVIDCFYFIYDFSFRRTRSYWRVFSNQCLGPLFQLIAAPQSGFIAPHVWEIVGWKNLTIFKGCHYSQFYIMISSSFRKIETKDLNSDPRILIFLVLGTNHQLHISYLNIRSDHDIEAATHGYS